MLHVLCVVLLANEITLISTDWYYGRLVGYSMYVCWYVYGKHEPSSCFSWFRVQLSMLSIEVDSGTGPTFYARTSVPILLQGAESGRDLDPRVEGSESDFTEPKDSCVVSRILQGARGVSQDPEVSTNNRLQGATGSTDPFTSISNRWSNGHPAS